MKWIKKGLVYGPQGESPWAKNSALTPTPIMIHPDTIRVYAGFRDDKGVSRIGFVDLDARDPSSIRRVSEKPALDVGIPGTFDDNGVILGDVVHHDDCLYMFYVGFQLVKNVKFLAFSGLAISTDKGETFLRKSKVPVLDRSDEGYYIRAIHTALFEDHTWKIWYAAGDAWEIIGGIPFPQYHIRYLESPTGRAFGDTGIRCVECSGREYRIGRPRVYKTGDRYTMFYTKGTLDGDYMAGYAESSDGKNWTRKDGELGIGLSPEGWDSRSVAYPALISFEDKTYMFYNGNDMGRDGFGYAILDTP